MTDTEDLLNSRAETHGDFHQGALIFNDITKHLANAKHLDSSHKYAISMIATKLARIMNGNPNEPDHWADICGYATLGGRLNLCKSETNEFEEQSNLLIINGGRNEKLNV